MHLLCLMLDVPKRAVWNKNRYIHANNRRFELMELSQVSAGRYLVSLHPDLAAEMLQWFVW